MEASTSGKAEERVQKGNWWQNLFATPNGDLSIARLQITWGSLVVMGYSLVSFVRARSGAGDLPPSIFIDGLIVLGVSGIALVMEARIERMPDLASLPVPQGLGSSPTSGVPHWFDVAVLQLGLGAFVIPLLLGSRALESISWRLITITIVSEFVYLAFLSAQLIQKEELIALLEAIREAKKSVAAADVDSNVSPDERLVRQKEQEEKLNLLQRRATVLMQQIGRTFPSGSQTPSPSMT